MNLIIDYKLTNIENLLVRFSIRHIFYRVNYYFLPKLLKHNTTTGLSDTYLSLSSRSSQQIHS